MYDFYAILWFVMSCISIRMLYTVVDLIIVNSRVQYKYINLPSSKKRYIQKNIVKSIYLAVLLCYALFNIVIPIYYNKWDSFIIHRIAVLYASNDFTGLICVDKLPTTTKIHHIVSTVMVFASLSLDFQHSDIAQAMFWYTLCSASAYIVNLQLGIRFLFHKNDTMSLRYVAARIYVMACIFNWTGQAFWVYSRSIWTWSHFVYLGLIVWIIRDDIILIQWLIK